MFGNIEQLVRYELVTRTNSAGKICFSCCIYYYYYYCKQEVCLSAYYLLEMDKVLVS